MPRGPRGSNETKGAVGVLARPAPHRQPCHPNLTLTSVEAWATGGTALSAVSAIHNPMRTLDRRPRQEARPAGEGSRRGPGRAEERREVWEVFSPGPAGPRLQNPNGTSLLVQRAPYVSPGILMDALLQPFVVVERIEAPPEHVALGKPTGSPFSLLVSLATAQLLQVGREDLDSGGRRWPQGRLLGLCLPHG